MGSSASTIQFNTPLATHYLFQIALYKIIVDGFYWKNNMGLCLTTGIQIFPYIITVEYVSV